MLNQVKVVSLLALSLLFVMVLALGLGVWGTASVATAASIEPQPAAEVVVLPPANHDDDEMVIPPVEVSEEDKRFLLEEMTFVQLLDEQYAYASTVCAGNGLNNIEPVADGPIVLIPNVGDLSLDGSNVSVKLEPNGEMSFIPRTQGQMMRVPGDIGDMLHGQEVLSLSFDEGMQFITTGQLIWTGKGQGPFGSGHGLPGHIAECDLQFDEDEYDDWKNRGSDPLIQDGESDDDQTDDEEGQDDEA